MRNKIAPVLLRFMASEHDRAFTGTEAGAGAALPANGNAHGAMLGLLRRGCVEVVGTDYPKRYQITVKGIKEAKTGRPSHGERTQKTAVQVSTVERAPDRTAAVKALGDGLVENVESAYAVLKATLESELEESSALIDTSVEHLGRAIALLGAGYKAAV